MDGPRLLPRTDCAQPSRPAARSSKSDRQEWRPILPHIVPPSAPARGGQAAVSGGMGCCRRLRSWTQTLNDKGVKVSRSFPPGTVVIAIVGATIGMTAILDVDVYCPDSVVGIQVNPKAATKEYIEFLLRFWRPVFLAQAPETARANINLDTLRPLRIPVPPLPLQQKFADLVERVERLRAVQREALRQAEHLFTSLLHRAFRG